MPEKYLASGKDFKGPINFKLIFTFFIRNPFKFFYVP